MDNSTPETAPVTVNQILDRFEAEYIPHELAPRTARDYRRHVGHLKARFGDRVADELRPKDFGPFLNIQGRGRTNRVRQLAVLSAAFSEAVSTWYWIERNVLRDVKRPKSKPRDRLVTEEEFATVKASAPLRVRLAMEIAVITGQRQGDILAMQLADIKDMSIHFHQSKTGKRLAIEITPDLEKVLDRCWQLPKGGCDGGLYVITRTCGGRFTSEGFRARWQETINRYCRLGGTRFTFHDLRALAATRCPTIEHAMYLLGHSNISMTRRVYRRGIERVKPVAMSAVMSA
jgi:integrase